MKLNNNMKILIVGLGLIGGSYAKALIKRATTSAPLPEAPPPFSTHWSTASFLREPPGSIRN